MWRSGQQRCRHVYEVAVCEVAVYGAAVYEVAVYEVAIYEAAVYEVAVLPLPPPGSKQQALAASCQLCLLPSLVASRCYALMLGPHSRPSCNASCCQQRARRAEVHRVTDRVCNAANGSCCVMGYRSGYHDLRSLLLLLPLLPRRASCRQGCSHSPLSSVASSRQAS